MRARLASSVLVLGLITAVLAGCGGSGSSSGPSGSGAAGSAVIQGQVRSTQTSREATPLLVVVLERALGIGTAEAQAGTPVAGATVQLLAGATVVATTTTDPSGNFLFQVSVPGTYTVQVLVGGVVVATTTVIVGIGDNAVVGVVAGSGLPPVVTVTASATDVFQNDAQLGHAVNIDRASASCDLVRVVQLREQGLGWGLIAQRCNAPPGVIGLGRGNLSDDVLEDTREAHGRGRSAGKPPRGPKA
jgi:hypothetical protein